MRRKGHGFLRDAAGVTLVELAIAITIVGIILAGAIQLDDRARAQRHFDVTDDNIDEITRALSVYAESSGRLPCPADPGAGDGLFGWERGVKVADLKSAAGRAPIGQCDEKTREGIVPFMSLDLPERMIRDGWGNFFTYAVSPVFTRDNDQSGRATDTAKIHGSCRHPGWVAASDRYNRNAIKARFCCADQSAPVFDVETDLIILHTDGSKLSVPRAAGTTASYDDLNKVATINGLPSVDKTPVEAPAFVLVSHGPDGKGAWLANGERSELPDGVERQNADGNQIFVDGPWNLTPGPQYFDDIVRWMTQDGIMAAHGALSCQYP